jgi:predicted nucleic acid-binding protein
MGARISLAQRHHLTVYDAAYLELAQRTGLPLATLDGDLRKAALAERVALVETA